MGYRHAPLSRPRGPLFPPGGRWRVHMADAECFLYFIANTQRLFGRGHTLYAEGRSIDDEVAALYLREAEALPAPVAPLDRHSQCRRFHVAMGPRLSRPLNLLAARKTYAQIGERLLVYRADAGLCMDGGRLGERVVDLSGSLAGTEVGRFASGPLRGRVEWVEE